MAQIAYNNSVNETTGQTPFFANHGFHAELFREPRAAKALAEAASVAVTDMKTLHQELVRDITFLGYRSAYFYNQHRTGVPMLKEGDKVYLLRKNIETTRPSKKLDHVKIGPFRIIRKIKDTNYELKLPKGMRIHPVFHISLLEPAPASVPVLQKVPDNYLMEQEGLWKAQKIIDSSNNFDNDELHYLVKWKDHPNSENTWEPVTNLEGSQRLIEEFRQRRGSPEKKATRKPSRQSRPRRS